MRALRLQMSRIDHTSVKPKHILDLTNSPEVFAVRSRHSKRRLDLPA
jgi:hypothetical protein